MSKFTEAIKERKNIVPNDAVTIGVSKNGGNVNVLGNLLAVLLSEKLGVDFKADN